MKKILHIIHGFGTGGAETWLLSCVEYLKNHPELSLQFDFLATGGQKLTYDDQILAYGSKIFYVKYSLKNFFKFSISFRKILIENNYYAIHDHQDFVSGFHFLAAWGALPRLRISHLHNPYNFVNNYNINFRRKVLFKLGRLLMVYFSTSISGTSNAVMDEYGYDRWPYKYKRSKPAYCGIDVERFSYNNAGKKYFSENFKWPTYCKVGLFVGRIGLHSYDKAKNQKNPEFAFDIACQLCLNDERFRFLFVGFKGKTGIEMEKSLVGTPLEDKVLFVGIRHDINLLMSGSDFLIFPSFWEGLGMVAVESQASGLPIIMSDSIPKESIIHSELVVRLPLNIGTKKWIETIYEISKNKSDRNSYKIGVQKSDFSIQNSVQNLINLYS